MINNYLAIILEKMCMIINKDFYDVDFEDPNYMNAFSWTFEEEQKYIKWYSNYIFKNKKACRELYGFTYTTKDKCITAAQWFVFQHGW
jgi:hypothetical protein